MLLLVSYRLSLNLIRKNMGALYDQWSIAVRTICTHRLFLAIQFISNGDTLEFGKSIQEQICSEVGIPEEEAENFWEAKGIHVVEESIRLKRSAAVANMKNTFLSQMQIYEESNGDVLLLPPDPAAFVPKQLLKVVQEEDEYEDVDTNTILPLEFIDKVLEKRLRSNSDSTARLQYVFFLYLFSKPVLGSRLFKRIIAGREPIEKYITPALEAFIVTAYVGNYDYWKQAYYVARKDKISNPNILSRKLQPLFTEHRRGAGKYLGWSTEGLFFYNCASLIIRHQRDNPTMTSEFSKLFFQLYAEKESPSKKRKRQSYVALNNLDCIGQVFRL